MSERSTVRAAFDRAQRLALGVAVVAGAVCVWGALRDREAFLRAWLVAFLQWLALPLGSLALVLLHRLTGGSWGFAIRRLLEAAMRTLPLLALAFVPVYMGLGTLYEWSHADVVAADPVLQHKAAWLNERGFGLRAVLLFGLWIALAQVVLRLVARLDRGPDARVERRLRGLAGPGIGLYVVSMTLAAVDWAMSLEPHWFSTLYGLIFVVGQGLSTFAFAIVVSAWLARREPFARWLAPGHFHDLGKLLFAFVMLWAYLAYSQYLIQWSGNLAEETPWYHRRSTHGWQLIATSLIALHFFLPFALLLLRKTKRTPALLGTIAAFLFAVRWLDFWWLVAPAFDARGARKGPHLTLLDIAAPLALGGAWVALFLFFLKGRPLLSLEDAGLATSLEAPTQGARTSPAGPTRAAQGGHS